MKKQRVFDEAIDAIRAVVDFSAAPDETVRSCKDAIRCLKVLDGAGVEKEQMRTSDGVYFPETSRAYVLSRKANLQIAAIVIRARKERGK